MRQDNQPSAVRSFDDDLFSIERPALAETTSHPALVMRNPLPVDRRHPERTAVPILRVVQLGFAPPGEYGTPVVVRDETLGIACIAAAGNASSIRRKSKSARAVDEVEAADLDRSTAVMAMPWRM